MYHFRVWQSCENFLRNLRTILYLLSCDCYTQNLETALLLAPFCVDLHRRLVTIPLLPLTQHNLLSFPSRGTHIESVPVCDIESTQPLLCSNIILIFLCHVLLAISLYLFFLKPVIHHWLLSKLDPLIGNHVFFAYE